MALYYPSITVRTFTTALGMVVSIPDDLYDSGVDGRDIIIVDAEQVILDEICNIPVPITPDEENYTRNVLENNSGIFRQLFTGDDMGNEEYRRMVVNACSICPRFGSYIVYQDLFGPKSLEGLARWLVPLRSKIDAAIEDILTHLESLRCSKFCMLSRDYIYYSVPYGEAPEFRYKYRVI